MSAPAQPGARVPVAQAAAVLAIGAAAKIAGEHVGWIAYEIAFGCFLVLAVVWPPRVPWRPVHARAVLRAYVPFVIAWLLFVFVYLRVMHAVGLAVAPQPGLQQLAVEGLRMPGFAQTILMVVVLAPVFEELVFRGYLLTALRAVMPELAAQLATAALFGAIHGWPYALPIGLLGLFFGWLRARHAALLPSMLAHGVHNGLTVALTLLWPGHLDYLYPR